MPLHNEDQSSGQVQHNAWTIKLVVLTMRRLEKSGYAYLSRQEIGGTTTDLFPFNAFPEYALNAAIRLLHHAGLIATDEPDQPHGTFRLTQAGRNFDLKQIPRLILGDAAA